MSSSTPLKTRSICSSSSVRSVMSSTRASGLVLANPLGQPDHGERLARPLGMPDDAALAPLDTLLRRLDAEVLVRSAGLLDTGVEHDEVVDDLQQAVLGCEQNERLVERSLDTGEFRSTWARVAGSMSVISRQLSQYFSGVSMTA